MDALLAKFQSVAIERGGLWFLRPADAITAVNSLEESGIDILGLDAFMIGEKTTQPISEHSADFSSKREAWASARDFLSRHLRSELVFELIVDN